MHREIAYSSWDIEARSRGNEAMPRDLVPMSRGGGASLRDRDTTTRDLPPASRSNGPMLWDTLPKRASEEATLRERAPVSRGTEAPGRGRPGDSRSDSSLGTSCLTSSKGRCILIAVSSPCLNFLGDLDGRGQPPSGVEAAAKLFDMTTYRGTPRGGRSGPGPPRSTGAGQAGPAPGSPSSRLPFTSTQTGAPARGVPRADTRQPRASSRP